jgi:hypothetical protein
MGTRADWRRAGMLAVLLMVGCASPAKVPDRAGKGTLVLSVRFPWTSSNDFKHCILSRLDTDGRTFVEIDHLGLGCDSDPTWSLNPGLYFLTSNRGMDGTGSLRTFETGVWVEVEAGRESRVDFRAVRIACEEGLDYD